MSVEFSDKHKSTPDFQEVTKHIKEKRDFEKSLEVSQEKAEITIVPEYPHLPIAIVFMTDIHYGNMGVDYDLLVRHLEIIENTPNTFVMIGGDLIDAFSPGKHPTAVREDAITPDKQIEAMVGKLVELDQKNKLVAVQIGNHDDWSDIAGYDFSRFLADLKCPIYSVGGRLDLTVVNELYKIYWAHTHTGSSKINITNSAKAVFRLTDPEAEISLLGHTHQSAFEIFDTGGKTKIAIVGGTYKQQDKLGKKWGLGSPGLPGITLLLWPDFHHKEVVKDPEIAKEVINALRD